MKPIHNALTWRKHSFGDYKCCMCYPKHKQILHKDDSVHSVIAKVFFNWKLGINHGKITSLKFFYNNHNKRNQMEYFKHQPKGSCCLKTTEISQIFLFKLCWFSTKKLLQDVWCWLACGGCFSSARPAPYLCLRHFSLEAESAVFQSIDALLLDSYYRPSLSVYSFLFREIKHHKRTHTYTT